MSDTSEGSSFKVILGSLAANLGLALAKAIAAFFTGSGAMLGEAIHSFADCSNQILLLVGAKQAARPPSEAHPMGEGRAAYFWSFLVAVMIFAGGAVAAIREGIEKIRHPEPLEHIWVGVAVLCVGLVTEGLAAWQAKAALDAKRGDVGFFAYLRQTTDVDLVVLFAENSSDIVGLLVALIAIALSVITHDPRWDGVGSLIIGVILTLVAWLLAREVKSLLVGERADPAIESVFKEEAAKDDRILSVLRILTVQQGPSQVMLAAKLEVKHDVASQDVIASINQLEDRVRARCPDVKWQFIEPDDREVGKIYLELFTRLPTALFPELPRSRATSRLPSTSRDLPLPAR